MTCTAVYILMTLLSVINPKIWILLKDNYSFTLIKFKTGPMRMAPNFQKLKLCTKCKSLNHPCLLLDGNPIQAIKEVEFLGVLFDKISFVPHIKMLKEKCTKGSLSLKSSHTPNGVHITYSSPFLSLSCPI